MTLIKSVLVKMPAKRAVRESQRGADTIAGPSISIGTGYRLMGAIVGMARDLDGRTVLNQDVETLLDEQVGIENDKAEREGQDIVAGANFEEFANRILEEDMMVSCWIVSERARLQ